MEVLVNTFSKHYRNKFGAAVGKIPLDTGQICPNRKHGGCIYCRPSSFTPLYLDKQESIAVQFKRGKAILASRKFRYVFGYFQQETATALPLEKFKTLFYQVFAEPDCAGLIISTRPDYLENDLLDWLQEITRTMNKEFLLEIGLQSSHDASLRYLNRNHTYDDFLDAVQRIQARGLQVGVHLILGIPGETQEDMLATVQSVCQLGVDALKFHHLQVIHSTPLHEIHKKNPVSLFSVESYLDVLVAILSYVPRHVVIHRLWSTAHPEVLVAPFWDMYAHELSSKLTALMRERGMYQGKSVL